MNKESKQLLLAVLVMVFIISLIPFSHGANKKIRREKSVGKKAKQATSSQEVSYDWKAYPDSAKTPEQALLLVEREVPKITRPNKDYTYVIKVSNKSFYQIDKVVLTEKLPDGFKLFKVFPQPQTRGKELKWDLGIMAPEQTEVITITGKASSPGKLYHSGNAKAIFSLDRMVAIMEVIEPSLFLLVDAPEEAVIGEDIPVKLQVKNSGSATVHDAKFDHKFLPNLTTKLGDQKISVNIGDLSPGQIHNIDFILVASKVGTYDNKFVVNAKDGVSASANAKFVVRKPRLKMVAKAPKKRFVGNVIKYKITVTNVGDGRAKDVVTKLTFPNGTSFASANEGGKVTTPGTIMWKVESLSPNETKEIVARVKAEKIMTVNAKAMCQAKAAKPLTVDLTTSVEGIAAILLLVDDINDPVPVGDTETYVITVSNQGSLPATNIKVTCDLEDGMQFVKSSGPTKGALGGKGEKKGKMVVFETLKTLAPKTEAVWQAVIRGKKDGDFRFNVNVLSDQLTRPVKEDESTTFYND